MFSCMIQKRGYVQFSTIEWNCKVGTLNLHFGLGFVGRESEVEHFELLEIVFSLQDQNPVLALHGFAS